MSDSVNENDFRYNQSNLEASFKQYLLAGNIKPSTLKNYLSDFRHFWGWLIFKLKVKNEKLKVENISSDLIQEYKAYLIANNLPLKTVNRRLSTLRKFCSFCISQGWMKENPAKQIQNAKIKIQNDKSKFKIEESLKREEDFSISKQTDVENELSSIQYPVSSIKKSAVVKKILNTKYSILNTNFGLQHYIVFAILLIFVSALASGLYNRFFKKTPTLLAYPSSPTKGGRVLSFQGRLTDTLGNPITTSTNVKFTFYNTATGGTSLHTTGTCSTTPDQDGIFSVLIGQDCGTEIPNSVFTENANVHLGVTVGTDEEMIPRQQIANVGYAINAETLQGLPPGTNVSNVPFINKDGNMLIAASSPGVRSTYTSTTFTISSAKAVTITSSGAGNITLEATGSGSIDFKTAGTTRMTMTNDGKLGIGTGNPGGYADIGPDISPEAAGTKYALRVDPNLTGNINTAQSGLYGVYNVPAVNLTGGSSNTLTSLYGDFIGLTATAGTVGTWYGQYLAAPTGSGTVSTKYALVTESGAGNVGIGTIAPSSFKVQVAGNVGPNADLTYDLGSTSLRWNKIYVGEVVGGSGGTQGWWQRNNQAISPTNITDDVLIGAIATASALVKFTGTADNNSWINTGNVGIGTTTPGAKLDVVGGNIRTNADTYSGDLYLGYDDTTATITTNDTNEDLTIDPNGSGTIYFHGSTYLLNSSGNLTFGATLTPTANFTLGSASYTGAITTSDWTIDATGNMTNIGTIGMDGDLTISQTTPSIFLTDTTVSEDDYSINIDGSSLTLRNETDSRNDITVSGAGVVTINGASLGEGTTTLGVTSGDLTLTDGDLTVSSGEIAATSDDATGTNFSFTTGALTTGTGLGVTLTSNVLTSGGGLAVSHTASSATGSFSGNLGSITSSRTNSTAAQTLTDSGSLFNLSRTTITSNATATTNVTGAILAVANTATPTLGTLTDSSALVKVTQDADATGALLHLVSNRSSTNYSLLIEQTDGGTDTLSLTDAGNLAINGDFTVTGGDINGPSGENIDLGEATADTITQYIGGTAELALSATALYPATDSGLDLGSTTNQFADLFLDGGNINLYAATDIDIIDNSTTAFTVSESTNNYLLVNTDNATTVVTVDLPVAGTTSTTANLFTSNVAKTINLGTGTAADTINIGTGGTTADAITLGNTGVATTIDINSGAATVNAIDMTTDSVSSANALALTANALTTGTALSLTSTSNAYSTGSILSASLTQSAATGTAVSGDTASLSFSPTYSTAVTTPTISGNVVDISRSVTTNSLFASTLTVSGALVSLSDSATQTTGTLTHTGNVLDLTQNYTSSSGTALYVKNYGGASSTSFRVDDASGDTSPFLIDAAGNVGIGDASPVSLLTVGSADVFQVNSSGDVVKLKNITYSWPSAQSVGTKVLKNDGTGTLTWGNVAGGGGGVDPNSLDYTEFKDTLTFDANLIHNQTTYTETRSFTGDTTVGLTYNTNSLTTGTALALSSTATSFNGEMLTISKTGASGSTAFTSDIVNVTYSQTFNATVVAANSGNVLDISRSITVDDATAGAISATVSGPLVTISDTCTIGTADTCTHSANTVEIAQNYTSSSGTALMVTNLGGASSVSFRVNDETGTGDTTPFLIDASGNVGIGTTGPGYKLDVVGDRARIVSNNIWGLTFGRQGFAGERQIGISGHANAPDMYFSSHAGAELVTITNPGNVGIGTTSPGGLGAGGSPTILHLNDSGSTGGTDFALLNLSNAVTTSGSALGSIEFGTTGASTTKRGGIILSSLRATATTNATASLDFYTTNAAGTLAERLRISAEGGLSLGNSYVGTDPGAGSMIISGNVGIGTTGPRNNVELTSANSGSAIVYSSLRIGGINQGRTTGGAGSEMTENRILFSSWRDVQTDSVGAKIAAINVDVGGGNMLGQGTHLAFFTNPIPTSTDSSVERMRIDKDGNVGIGTTGPNTKLTVLNSGTLVTPNSDTNLLVQNDSTTATNARINIVSGNAAEAILEFGDAQDVDVGAVQYNHSNNQLQFATNGVYDRVVIDSSGNVGIGTTNPGADVSMTGGLTINGTNSTQLTIQKSGTTGLAINVGEATVGDVNFYDKVGGGFNRAITLKSGNVGIGTTGPGAKLDVSGVGPGNPSTIKISNTNGKIWQLGEVQANNRFEIYDTAVGARLAIDTSGNVGIGTTAPTVTTGTGLHVEGIVRAQLFEDTVSSSTRYLDFGAATSLRIAGDIQSDDATTFDIISGSNVTINLTSTASTAVCVGGGTCTGKLDAGTVDPPYTINGKKYATYLTAMTGVKEETTGVISLKELKDAKLKAYGYTIDFNNLEEGSDLWLFSKTTNLRNNIDRLVALLTPSDNTRVWYKTDKENFKLTLYSSRPTTVSYRLTAPRFNAEEFPNKRPDDASSGFVINDEDKPITLGEEGDIVQTEEYKIVVDSQEASVVLGTPPWRGTPESGRFWTSQNDGSTSQNDAVASIFKLVNQKTGEVIEELVTASQAIIANVKAGLIEAENVVVNNILVAKNIVAENITAQISNFQFLISKKIAVSERLVSPVVETTDLVATGTAQLAKIETGEIKPQNQDLVIDLDSNVGVGSPDPTSMVMGEKISPLQENGETAAVNGEAVATAQSTPEVAQIVSKGKLAKLIIRGLGNAAVASIDAAGNASFSGTLTASEATISGQLTADAAQFNEATISGTLVASKVEAENIKALEDRLNVIATSSSVTANDPSVIASEAKQSQPEIASSSLTPRDDSGININDIQRLLAKIKDQSLPDAQYYQNLPSSVILSSPVILNEVKDPATEGSVNNNYASLDSSPASWRARNDTVEDLTVLGQANLYTASVANSLTVGSVFIQDNAILSLAWELRLSALSTINLLDGAVIVARDGTLTTKGAVIAQGGIRTSEIKPLSEGSDISVILSEAKNLSSPDSSVATLPQNDGGGQTNGGQAKFKIQNQLGNEVASVDASGSARFADLSLSKYLAATSSAAIVAADVNFSKNGLFAPAIKTNSEAAGIGLLPALSNEIVIYNDKVHDSSLIYVTATSPTQNKSLFVAQKQACPTNSTNSDQLPTNSTNCQPYFKVAVDSAISDDIKFNWWIIN